KFTDIRPVDDIRKLTSTYLPDINILSSVSTLNNFDPILPARFANFLNEIESAQPENRNRYLELANVKWMAAVNPSNLQEVRWQKIDANQRIKLISCAKSVENGTQSLEWLRTAVQQDRIKDEIVVEANTMTEPFCDNAPSTAAIIISTASSMKQVIQINGINSPAWLFVADSWYPGWQAKVDGVTTDLYRADYLFMAVPIPAGDHTVEIVYRPISFLIGSILSLIGAIILLIMSIFPKMLVGEAI
ncbi:MAG TPA: YfhO family protein, partial [Leptolinea sp.]